MKNFSSRTKENSLLNYKEERRGKPLLWILVAFLVLVFAKDILASLSSAVTTPFFLVRHYIETSGGTVPVFVRSRIELLSQIRDLESRLLAEEGKEARFAFLLKENEELKNLFQGTSTEEAILAGVISRPPYTPYDTLIIDKGSEDGIVLYAPVYFGEKVALGYVRKVFPGNSLVTLFSSPGAESTVYVFGPNIFTQAYGEGGGVVRISIPQGLTVEKGNVVVLPSLDAQVLGTIDHVESTPTEPEQDAYVLLDIPLQSIRLVSVGVSPIRGVTFEEVSSAVEEAERTLFIFDIPEDARISTSTQGVRVSTSTGSTTP